MFEYGVFRFAFNFKTRKVDNIILQISTIKRVSHSYICIVAYVQ
jgi:hypothetical protein